jgi:hypothetical protein
MSPLQRLLNVTRNFFWLKKMQHSDITYLRFCFSGTCENHHPEQALDDGIIQAVWLNKEEIKENEDKMRSPMVTQCIDDYLSGKKYPLDLINSYLAD